jgi:hypothetical protein
MHCLWLKIYPPLATRLGSSYCYKIADQIQEQGVSHHHRQEHPPNDPSLAHHTMTLNSFKDVTPLFPPRGALELLRPHIRVRQRLEHLNENF